MQVIIISPNNKTHKHWHLSRTKLMILSSLMIALIAISAYATMNYWQNNNQSQNPVHSLKSTAIPDSFVQSPSLDQQSTPVYSFYAKRLGQLQAQAIRLNALTEELATMSGLDVSQFLLTDDIAQGGIEKQGDDLSNQEFNHELQQLSLGFKEQHQQLLSLQDFLITNDSIVSAIPQGRPIKGGWISSYYGNRIDPFTGKKAFHRGMDLAGKSGSGVYSVADGIVTWIGERSGYGGLVEVDHGNGYVTRYAHNKTINVIVGDKVNKGQVLALMGSTGRSTGPHVHFEVLRDGKNINPYSFVKK
jgi:murein DD-endopeptidase MepM/ murein hydrolase activator NlpD